MLLRRKIILPALFTCIMLAAMMNVSWALPTPAGTTINSEVITVNVSMTYITTANPFVSIEVQPIYGILATPTPNNIIVASVNAKQYFPHALENKANTADILSITVNATPDWSVSFLQDDNRDGVHQVTEVTTLSSSITLAAQASTNIFVCLTPILFTPVTAQFTVDTAKPAVEYIGFNGEYYGGLVQVTANDILQLTGGIAFSLKTLLQGFYNPSTNMQVPTYVSVELRDTRVQVATSYTVTIKADGWSDPIRLYGVMPGNYYMYVKHYNHAAVATSANIAFPNETLVTINISETDSPFYYPIYTSPLIQAATQTMRQEKNGKLTVRGGEYNTDNAFNIVDWSAFDYEWKNVGFIADFDGNGMIDTRDYGIWLSNNQVYVPID